MPKAKNKQKRERGRPAIEGRRVVVKLEERHIRRAIELGGGENRMSAGIRRALEGKK